MPVSRYAPSPTGPLHLGNVRTALLAWLQARLYQATLILRMEDLDLPRVKTGSAEQIVRDLSWLGLDWDAGPEPGTVPYSVSDQYHQSRRTRYYRDALHELYDRRLVYPCYCSRKDIREAASAPHGRLPVYPGTCRNRYRNVSPENEPEIDGRKPAWRFIVCDQEIEFEDMLMGQYKQNLLADVGDFVIRRSDGLYAYQLAVVVDDTQMAVTDVLRGEDLLDSTCRQIALFRALEASPPRFWHVGLMCDHQGNRLSKRDGSDSIDVLRDQGMTAPEIVGQLAFSCGLLDKKRSLSPRELLQELTQHNFISLLQAGMPH